jgi:hypothetical protein
VHAAVYRLREHGIRLSRPQLAVVGELGIRPHTIGTRDPSAVMAQLLLDDGNDALPPLHNAQVRRLTRGGVMIVGTELIGRDTSKARVRSYPQTWWCLLVSDAALRRLAGTQLMVGDGLVPGPTR